MPEYRYAALDKEMVSFSGLITGESEGEVRLLLGERGLFATEIAVEPAGQEVSNKRVVRTDAVLDIRSINKCGIIAWCLLSVMTGFALVYTVCNPRLTFIVLLLFCFLVFCSYSLALSNTRIVIDKNAGLFTSFSRSILGEKVVFQIPVSQIRSIVLERRSSQHGGNYWLHAVLDDGQCAEIFDPNIGNKQMHRYSQMIADFLGFPMETRDNLYQVLTGEGVEKDDE